MMIKNQFFWSKLAHIDPSEKIILNRVSIFTQDFNDSYVYGFDFRMYLNLVRYITFRK